MPDNMRNIAIIAHVDHGKTTLVDHLLKQSGTFRQHEQVEERYMDSMDLEKERGITIAAKNASFIYQDVKVNIVDTPGHSDFGGEVERILNMVDGAILLVDASEGPLPQTRFVLKKALEQNLKIIVCINKIDRQDARINEVLDDLFALFIDLDATDEQADFPVVYAIAREGKAMLDPDDRETSKDLTPLFDMILKHIPAPKDDPNAPLQMLISNISYNDYVGRLAIGRLRGGKISVSDELLLMQEKENIKFKVTALFAFQASRQVNVTELSAGDIAIVAGLEKLGIGDTITTVDFAQALPRLAVDEPTVGMMLSVNDGPFAGREGKKVTSRNLKERLARETLLNVAIRIEDTANTDTWKVVGRGELQLAVMMEQMRREGYEMLASKPQVVIRHENGQKLEPMEHVTVDVEESYTGAVTKKLGERKGIMMNMHNKGSGRVRLEFSIPSRGLIGYRSEFLTDTRGTGLLNTQFAGWEPYKGDISSRNTGAMMADRTGRVTAYALEAVEERGRLFVVPGDEVYEGMVVGETSKGEPLNVNVCREKKLTNFRAVGKDDNVKLAPVKPMTLDQAMEWISDEELIEVTPKTVRIRCRQLDPNKRKNKA